MQLIRFGSWHGTALLFLPALWVLASQSWALDYQNYFSITIFLICAFLFRSAGCAYNDSVDAKKDALVERTKYRPVASGKITRSHALIASLVLAALGGLLAVLFLDKHVVLYGMAIIPLVAIYPWLKRFTHFTQVWLAIIFNFAAPLYSQELYSSGYLGPYEINLSGYGLNLILIYFVGVFWTLAYDVIYGFQDFAEDKKAGIKSMPVLFGYKRGKLFIGVFYCLMTLCLVLICVHRMLTLGMAFPADLPYLIALIGFTSSWITMLVKLDLKNAQSCRKAFLMQPALGIIVAIGLFLLGNWSDLKTIF